MADKLTNAELKLKIRELTKKLQASKSRERKLKEAESYYRAFFEHGTDGVVILDPETTRPIDFNDQVCRQLGYTQEEFARLRLLDIEAKEDAEAISVHVDNIVKNGFDSFETLHRTKDGDIRHVQVTAQIITVGARDVYHCIWSDITDRKRSENNLRESEDKFSLTFNFSPDAVSINRLEDGLYVDINEGFTRITGFGRDELIGRSSLDLNIWVNTEDREKLVQGLKAQGFYENLEAKFRRKNGQTFTGLMSARIISLKGVPHLLSISRDISERKQHERELLKFEKLQSLGILAGGIAHDFNNVLTSIRGNISLAKAVLDTSHKSAKPLAMAEQATIRAGELAHQLLTFARGGEPIKKVISPHFIIEEALSLVLHGSNVKASVDIPDSIHAFEADEGQMSQVFHNIIINSTQAMPTGGTFTVVARNETLTDHNPMSLPSGTYIRLTFADQGCGIPSEDLPKIFDPYFTTKSAGNGLGLASAYSIISKHKGSIHVSSLAGSGTLFTIYLPSTGERYVPPPEDGTSQDRNSLKGGSTLVMDDEIMVRETARSMLQHLGYQVTTCDCGEEAVELYRKSVEGGTPFSIVIMDLTIPGGLGGKEAAEQILSEFPQARLVVSSGYSNDSLMSQYSQFGFIGAIAKPYSISDFSRILKSLATD